jgi:DNA-binding transcriptional LysR family regulator
MWCPHSTASTDSAAIYLRALGWLCGHRVSPHGRKRGRRQQLVADVVDELAILLRLGNYGDPFGIGEKNGPTLLALGRIAARFALAYPEVQLEIVSEDRVVDLVEEAYDLVIRINPSPEERLVGRCSSTMGCPLSWEDGHAQASEQSPSRRPGELPCGREKLRRLSEHRRRARLSFTCGD